MITATQARQLSLNISHNKVDNLQKLTQLITAQIHSGSASIIVTMDFSQDEIKQIRSAGYSLIQKGKHTIIGW